jgi:hypothetical protein
VKVAMKVISMSSPMMASDAIGRLLAEGRDFPLQLFDTTDKRLEGNVDRGGHGSALDVMAAAEGGHDFAPAVRLMRALQPVPYCLFVPNTRSGVVKLIVEFTYPPLADGLEDDSDVIIGGLKG